jgi:REP element-mobilizing transposase RayT
MPDHVHLVLTPRKAGLSDIMRNLKSFCAKQIRDATGNAGAVWQSRFHDRAIRSEMQYRQAIEYVHHNPVKAGLVRSGEDYEYSSARVYAGWTDVELGVDAPDGSRLGP